ncbi:hypothetical protein V1477_012728 [Vespula maculifrons]|uniref:Large ribosomal subunit protein bL33m n=1 Tax=Vespula maculifrons TaxID=7453 RepID=A0ABD2BTW6_VESMC
MALMFRTIQKLIHQTDESRSILVLVESVVSGHTKHMVRERVADKIEVIQFDPYIQTMAIYKEKKKVRDQYNQKLKKKS